MKETRRVNSRWTYVSFKEKVSKELRLPIERIDSLVWEYTGGNWYKYTYETDIPWKYR